jgi:hypothetical protein
MATAEEASPIAHADRAILAATALVAVVHLALLVAVPADPPVLELALAEAGLGVALLALFAWADSPYTSGLLGLLWLTFVGGAWALTVLIDSLLTATLVFAGIFALLVYGLHRYELVAMGLVEATDE